MIRRSLLSLALLTSVAPQAPAQSLPFTSLTATTVAISGMPACLKWCSYGICFWVTTTIPPAIVTSLRIRHQWPDLVVTAWTHDLAGGTGGNPYTEADLLYGSITYALGQPQVSFGPIPMGGGNNSPKDRPQPARGAEVGPAQTGQQRHRTLRFKDTMAVGHPLTLANPGMAGIVQTIPAFCPSEAQPLRLYYASYADAYNWRSGTVDLLLPHALPGLIPGFLEVGVPFVNVYGPLYPRTGWVHQPSDFKAAAVTAQRTADIVTRSLPPEPRIYSPLQRPVPVPYISDPGVSGLLTSQWQAIKPVPVAACLPFGTVNLAIEDGQGRYGWNLWQDYSCCVRVPNAIFVSWTPVNPLCILL